MHWPPCPTSHASSQAQGSNAPGPPQPSPVSHRRSTPAFALFLLQAPSSGLLQSLCRHADPCQNSCGPVAAGLGEIDIPPSSRLIGAEHLCILSLSLQLQQNIPLLKPQSTRRAWRATASAAIRPTIAMVVFPLPTRSTSLPDGGRPTPHWKPCPLRSTCIPWHNVIRSNWVFPGLFESPRLCQASSYTGG